MSLVNFAVELSKTNELLERIANALDRLSPVAEVDQREHPLIGLSDISRYKARSSTERDTMAIRASQHVSFAGGSHAGQTGLGAQTSPASTPISRVGQHDADDALDSLDDYDDLGAPWENYAGSGG